MDLNTVLLKLFFVVLLGMLAGLERDHSWRSVEDDDRLKQAAEEARRKFSFIDAGIPARSFGGVRTYTLLALLGAVVGLGYSLGLELLPIVVFIAIASFILVSFILNYFDKNSFGLTTELSLILNFIMAVLLFATDIPIKIVVGIVVFETVVLSMKSELRGLVSKFTATEVLGILKFVLVSLVVLPFLPNYTYSLAEIFKFTSNTSIQNVTWMHIPLFNPLMIWIVVTVISSLNFIGYFLVKKLGNKKGLGITGLIGGLVSSTAVTQSMAEYSKQPKFENMSNSFVLATILANITQFFRIYVVALFINGLFASKLFVPMAVMSLVMIVSLFFIKDKDGVSSSDINLQFKSPFAIKPALKFAILFMFVVAFTKLALEWIGDSGFLVSSLISAFSGLDAVTINTASFVGSGISMKIGVVTLVLAAVVNLIIKMAFVTSFGSKNFYRKINAIFILSSVLGVLSILLVSF